MQSVILYINIYNFFIYIDVKEQVLFPHHINLVQDVEVKEKEFLEIVDYVMIYVM